MIFMLVIDTGDRQVNNRIMSLRGAAMTTDCVLKSLYLFSQHVVMLANTFLITMWLRMNMTPTRRATHRRIYDRTSLGGFSHKASEANRYIRFLQSMNTCVDLALNNK